MLTINYNDPMIVELCSSIKTGNVNSLSQLLSENHALVNVRIAAENGVQRTPLHIATDWPGYLPNAPTVARMLIEQGADTNAPIIGARHAETPLHWAASTDDVDVAEVLIDGGADLEARRGSIADGTPLDNAVGYGCWQVAKLLVERGAPIEKLWHAAGLGMVSRLQAFFDAPVPPTPVQVHEAFWQACHGGRLRAAQFLLERGADVHWIPPYAPQSSIDITAAPDTARDALITWLRETGARSVSPPIR